MIVYCVFVGDRGVGREWFVMDDEMVVYVDLGFAPVFTTTGVSYHEAAESWVVDEYGGLECASEGVYIERVLEGDGAVDDLVK